MLLIGVWRSHPAESQSVFDLRLEELMNIEVSSMVSETKPVSGVANVAAVSHAHRTPTPIAELGRLSNEWAQKALH